MFTGKSEFLYLLVEMEILSYSGLTAVPATPTNHARRNHKRKLNNLAVVRASLLPFKAQWQGLANQMPEGSVLVVVPRTNGRVRQSAEMVVRYLRAEGRAVMVMAAERLFLGTLSQIEAR
jgi:hypothetical protein